MKQYHWDSDIWHQSYHAKKVEERLAAILRHQCSRRSLYEPHSADYQQHHLRHKRLRAHFPGSGRLRYGLQAVQKYGFACRKGEEFGC